MNIAVIPIRSGSKGLQNKNMLELKGKPLVGWTIEALLNSKVVNNENIFVSTDSKIYISELKRMYPQISYHLRRPELANDTATTADFLTDFLKQFDEETNFILCQATSPLRSHVDINDAYSLFEQHTGDIVVSVKKAEEPEELYSRMSNKGKLIDIVGIDQGYRRQAKTEKFLPNGAIYISNIASYLANPSFFTTRTRGFVMDNESSIDIDSLNDFKIAEMTLSSVNNIYKEMRCNLFSENNFRLNEKSELFVSDGSSKIIYEKFRRKFGNVENIFTAISFKEIIYFLSTSWKCKSLSVSCGLEDLKFSSEDEVIERFERLVKICQKNNISLTIYEIVGPKFDLNYDENSIERLNKRINDICSVSNIIFRSIAEG